MKKTLFLIIALRLSVSIVIAQHDHSSQKQNTSDSQDTIAKNQDMYHEEKDNMSHAFSLNLPMGRNGSGTGWLVDASPMYGVMYHSKHWMYMLHGNLFLRYNNQDFTNKGSRGDSKLDAPNWLMFMTKKSG